MRKFKYERPSINVIVSKYDMLLSGSEQRPDANSKECDFDFGFDDDDSGTTPSLQSFDDEEEE